MSGPAQQTTVSATMTRGFPGMVSDTTQYKDVVSKVNTSVAADPYVAADTELQFGFAVVKGTGDSDVKNITANTDTVVGPVVHSHAYEKDVELGDLGLKHAVTVGVMRHGRMLVYSDEAVTPADAVRIRCDTNGAHKPGAFCKTASAGHTLHVTAGIKWVESAGPGPVEVEIDMTNFAATAD